MLRALKSDTVQIASTAAGLALAAYFVTQWQARKKIDPSIDPLRSGADPNFPGGKPIHDYLHDPSPVVPSCEVYDPVANLFFNLGDTNLDADRDRCFKNVDPSVIVRYVDKDEKVWTTQDSLYYPSDVRGECWFPDANGKLYMPPIFAAPNQGQRLCFNSSDTENMSSFFFLSQTGFTWNPNINFASSKLDDVFSVTFPNGANPGSKDVDEVQILTDAILHTTDPAIVPTMNGQIFIRDPSATGTPSVTDIDGAQNKRLFLPSRGVIVYFNPHATDATKKFVSYPMLAK